MIANFTQIHHEITRIFHQFLIYCPQHFNPVRESMNSQSACINMIKQQLRTGAVLEQTILDLYHEIDRSDFVPTALKSFAYSDMQIELAHGQRMLTPLEEATLLQALNLTGQETVLEVGTGSGFMTALLSRLSRQVISLDYFADFTTAAQKKLATYPCQNVTLITGDASQGWLDKAPYDVVVFTGAIEELTDTHRLQVLPGGKLFAIVGKSPAMQGQLHALDHNNQWQKTVLFETQVPLLINPLKSKDFVF